MKDGEASRRRLLEAAGAEFAAHGIAGARVDRISATARVNKAQLYAWFGDKSGLFDAVFHQHADLIVNTVPLTAEDLPGYAVRLYDACLARPELVRLAAWTRLERVPTGALVTDMPDQTRRKLQAIADAQRSGHIVSGPDPADVLALVSTMALTWSSISLYHTATQADPEADHVRRRTALADAVRNAFVPHAERPAS
jgi:AcrR family transcriptional regulator